MPPQELLSSQDSEQELLLENFKAAANCLTNLYRNSLNVEKRAKNLGVQYALESVLSWVGEQASTGKQTVSLEELVSFCYQLSDQLGSGEVMENNLRLRFGERRSDVNLDNHILVEQASGTDKNYSEIDQANVASAPNGHGLERKRSRRTYEAEFASQGVGPVFSDWTNKEWNGENRLYRP
ncbi:hypothetical protein GpartN1_g2719.t1 [Galdieria partita]|uniref:Uncharacterized protein n=1 Tax=Galdieria partita TaxID=83374 RepID=A0A9C7UPJ2_9RHOD|nr:hypothetical protein GpartN1_g2719.t1 [Galdieria partita]